MKILITGNLGYVGPHVIKTLRTHLSNSILIGLDTGYFASNLTNVPHFPENLLDVQYYGDVRSFDSALLDNVDCVIYLAAISNDPMGNKFEKVTMDVNAESAIKMAEIAKQKGAKSFVFASSCSIYGEADDEAKKEGDRLNPLTAYARSKVDAEVRLKNLASEDFIVTCFRFATACGFSERLRLDLVLNDFVAGALVNKEINILSDGTPWRPLIHVKDMARAIHFGVLRTAEKGGNYLAVNTGSNEWNYQVVDIANAVAKIIEGTSVTVNASAPPDKRSYKVNFDLFKSLAPSYQPEFTLNSAIVDLYENLQHMNFSDKNFRQSSLIRLHVLNSLQYDSFLNEQLIWSWNKEKK